MVNFVRKAAIAAWVGLCFGPPSVSAESVGSWDTPEVGSPDVGPPPGYETPCQENPCCR